MLANDFTDPRDLVKNGDRVESGRDREEVTARRLTSAGRGGVAVVEFQGPVAGIDALFASLLDRRVVPDCGRLWYRSWRGEAVVICRVADLVWEVHCHGGEQAVSRILNDARAAGAALIEADAATTTGGLQPWQQEWELALRGALTPRMCELLCRWPPERLASQFALWEQQLQSGDPVKVAAARVEMERSLQASDIGRRATTAFRVVVAGAPNVGKSSLLNALAGFERAIVSAQPGTTRDVVTLETAFAGWPFHFSDTAGLRETTDPLESAGISRAIQELQHADLILQLVSVGVGVNEASLLPLVATAPRLLVVNKIDMVSAEDQRRLPDLFPDADLFLSAKTGEGLVALIDSMLATLGLRMPSAETLVPFTQRQIARLAELLGH